MSAPEYITYLSHMRGDAGDTRLLAGTRSKLFCNTGSDANWRIIYDGAGGTRPEDGVPETRWRSCQVGNIALFTNGVDYPLYWTFEGAPDPETHQACQYIDDLVALDITSARAIAAWRGFVFIGNVVTEGVTNTNRIYWSDFNDPLSFQPLPDSTAGYIDLGADERVLNMAPLGGQFRVYTDKAIYDVNLVGGDEVFNFREVYRGPAALRFENSLVNLGAAHIYCGEDTIYMLGEFDRSPIRYDWIHKASGAIYDGVREEYLGGIPTQSFSAFGPINRASCHNVVGGYNEEQRQVWISWPAEDDDIPEHTLVLQLDTNRSCIVNHGFTAFVSHLPSYQTSVRRWLSDIGACDPATETGLIDREGNPEPSDYTEYGYSSIRNETEDPDLPVDPDSLCARFDAEPLLEPDCTPCGNGYVFVMADAHDKCLKQYDEDYYARERVVTPEENRSGLPWTSTDHPTTLVCYESDGYVTIVQTDSQDWGTATNKTVQRIALEYDAADVEDSALARMHADVGYGSQPRKLIWQDSTPRKIDRLSDEDYQALVAANKRPNRMATYQFFRTGSQLGLRLMVADANKLPVTGGEVSFNELSLGMRVSHGDYV